MGMGVQAVPDMVATNTRPVRSFYPSGTMRCDGSQVFRSQAARQVVCLLDLDTGVVL